MARKERNRKGQWCLTESARYKGPQNRMGGFKKEAEEKFNELAAEKYDFKSGCPDGYRSQGSKTISGKRREVCCTPDGKVCMTADGIPL